MPVNYPYANITIIMPQRRKKNIFFSLVTAILTASFSLHAASPAVVTEGSTFTHRFVTEEKLRAQVEFLSDSICGGRATGTTGASEAASWVARHFRDMGMQVQVKSYHARGGVPGRNVIGFVGGSSQDSYVIIAAHYDGLGRLNGKLYPGADSDCSGVAALLGLGEMIHRSVKIGKVYRRNLLLVALDGKYNGMSGSAALWEDLSKGAILNPATGSPITPDKVTLMVNLDQMGSCMSPLHKDSPNYLIMLSGQGSDYLRASLRSANSQYRLGLDLGMDYYGSKEFTRVFYEKVSDQKPFVEHGRRAVMFTSGITMNNNKVHDSPQTLDYTLLKKRIWLIFHWLERVI